LLRAVKLFLGLLGLALIFVLVDFSVDIRPSEIHSSYRFTIAEIPFDQPVWLQQENLRILLIRRSPGIVAALKQQTENLQNSRSNFSRQPDFARNPLRSRGEVYFVAYGTGTDLGCPLESDREYSLRESCGTARYDFAGRAIVGQNQFQNLAIPDYNFSDDFKLLTIRP
jgi:ubiquinol-cytochrome c reductase iron-sulfur subunit